MVSSSGFGSIVFCLSTQNFGPLPSPLLRKEGKKINKILSGKRAINTRFPFVSVHHALRRVPLENLQPSKIPLTTSICIEIFCNTKDRYKFSNGTSKKQ